MFKGWVNSRKTYADILILCHLSRNKQTGEIPMLVCASERV